MNSRLESIASNPRTLRVGSQLTKLAITVGGIYGGAELGVDLLEEYPLMMNMVFLPYVAGGITLIAGLHHATSRVEEMLYDRFYAK